MKLKKGGDKFQGFNKPESNYFRLPNEWTNLTAAMKTWAEHKVVEYILRHTWGFQEYGLKRRITLDEFMNGRKLNDGARIDTGTGMGKKAVIDGIRLAIEDGFLEEETDSADPGRIKKYYALRMTEAANDSKSEQSVQGFDHRTSDVRPSNPRGSITEHRTEKDTTLRHFRNNVGKNHVDKKDEDEVGYYAELLADKLNDRKSLSFYKAAVRRRSPHLLLEKASEIVSSGQAKNPGAVFVQWLKER